MAVCPHTGVSRPECSCRSCVQALIEQHAPGAGDQTEATQFSIEPARVRRLAGGIRELRLRRVA